MSILKIVWAWTVRSSADSAKVSLTVRGFLVGFVTLLTVWSGIAGVQLPNELLTEWVDSIIAFIQSAAILISSAVTAWGLFRKVWSTVSGDNAVLNEHPAFNNK